MSGKARKTKGRATATGDKIVKELEARLAAAARGKFNPSPEEDADTDELVVKAQAGDGDSFARIYRRYLPHIYGYLSVLLNDRDEAEDAAQQVFMQVFERLGAYQKRRQPFRAWLFVVARNYALTLRKHNERVVPIDPAELAAALEDDTVDEEAILRVLEWISDPELTLFVERLPLVQRQILALRFLFDLTDVRIAKILDCHRDDVRAHQYRAMIFLRDRLAAVGRTSARRDRDIGMTSCPNQAFVLRERRFSLWK